MFGLMVIQQGLRGVEGRLGKMDGRLVNIEYRLAELEARLPPPSGLDEQGGYGSAVFDRLQDRVGRS